MSDFLDRSLDGDDLRQFIIHIKKCPVCEEELGTEYLLKEALPRIENGETVKLKNELDLRLYAAEKANSTQWVLSNFFRSIEVVAGIALALSAVRAFVIYIVPQLPI